MGIKNILFLLFILAEKKIPPKKIYLLYYCINYYICTTMCFYYFQKKIPSFIMGAPVYVIIVILKKMGDIPCILFLHDLIFYILYNQTCYNLKTERENILIYLSKKHICKLYMCIASTMTNYLFEIIQACCT